MVNPLILILELSIAVGSIAHGWTYRSPTSSALSQVGLLIQMHQDATGETIRNWEEFDRGIFPEWISEKRFEAWIVDERLTPPAPDSVGRYPHEKEYWMSVCVDTAIGVAGVGYVTFSLARYIRGKEKSAWISKLFMGRFVLHSFARPA